MDGIIKIQGQEIELSNLDKILWPKTKTTKGEMIEYYINCSKFILPFLKNRPMSMKRFPDGVEKFSFYEKNAPKFTPSWVKTLPIKSKSKYAPPLTPPLNGGESKSGITNYILVNNLKTLVWVANLASIELHVWLSSQPLLNNPDVLLFDLDPTGPNNFKYVAKAALLINKKLKKLGIRSFAKTTGGRGLHVQVPIVPNVTFEETREFCKFIGEQIANSNPDLLTFEENKEKRQKTGKVFFDWTQNGHSNTMITPYSLRASGANTYACPVLWSEVKNGITPPMFTIKNFKNRIKKCNTVWKGYEKKNNIKSIITKYKGMIK